MDKQSFLDQFFRRIQFSRRRFGFSNAQSIDSAGAIFKCPDSPQKNNHKNILCITSDAYVPATTRYQSRFAVSIEATCKKNRNVKKPTKNPLFMHVQPIKQTDIINTYANQLQRQKMNGLNTKTSDIMEQIISATTKQIPERLETIHKRNTISSNRQNIQLGDSLIQVKSVQLPNEIGRKQHFQLHHKISVRSQKIQKQKEKDSPQKLALKGLRSQLPQQKSKIMKSYKQLEQKQKRQKLKQRKQIHLQYLKPFNPPSNITAYSYIIYKPSIAYFEDNYQDKSSPVKLYKQERKKKKNDKFPNSDKIVLSHNSRTPVEVASLTKIMTCILALELCQKYKINAKIQRIITGKFQSNIGGTSAQISQGQIYTLEDLYYGLMLPSGNDASVAIACWGGRFLFNQEELSSKKQLRIHKKKACYTRYIAEMNALGRKIGLQKTTYANSHGLVNNQNKSCAYDIAVLCEYAMTNQKFRNIVSTQTYKTTILCLPQTENDEKFNLDILSPHLLDKQQSQRKLNFLQEQNEDEAVEGEAKDLDSNEDDAEQEKNEINFLQKIMTWQNTHKLIHSLPQQYLGIKTGITTAAGPCLASCIRNLDGRIYIIVVLNCEKLSSRFRDTQNLKKWLFKKEGTYSPKKKNRISQSPTTLYK